MSLLCVERRRRVHRQQLDHGDLEVVERVRLGRPDDEGAVVAERNGDRRPDTVVLASVVAVGKVVVRLRLAGLERDSRDPAPRGSGPSIRIRVPLVAAGGNEPQAFRVVVEEPNAADVESEDVGRGGVQAIGDGLRVGIALHPLCGSGEGYAVTSVHRSSGA